MATGPAVSSRIKAVVLTVSDRVSEGTAKDESGPEAARLLEEQGFQVAELVVVPDDAEGLGETLTGFIGQSLPLIVTTGGTGVAPRDVTPDVTHQLCDRMVPGISELMRKVSLEKTPHAALSRAVAGISGQTLIVNLPGSPGGVRDCLAVLAPVLQHAVALITEQQTKHLQTS